MINHLTPSVPVICHKIIISVLLRHCGYRHHLWILVNSLWPGDTTWRHRSESTLDQVMACCLVASSHYLTQYWLSAHFFREKDPWYHLWKVAFLECHFYVSGANELTWLHFPLQIPLPAKWPPSGMTMLIPPLVTWPEVTLLTCSLGSVWLGPSLPLSMLFMVLSSGCVWGPWPSLLLFIVVLLLSQLLCWSSDDDRPLEESLGDHVELKSSRHVYLLGCG